MADKKTKKKKAKWIKKRHNFVQNVAYCLLYPYYRLKFGIKPRPFKEENGRQYLVLYNHQTSADMFFVGMCFKKPLYYVATEDIFSLGWISKLISFLVAPIPIKKQANDVKAVLNCMRVVKEGGSICLAPEGNRTYSGETAYFKESIVGLARALKLPIAICKIEGGYGVQPRWTDKVRRGKMTAGVTSVIEYDTYSNLSDSELYALIGAELYVNENNADALFKSNKRAEYIERVLYVCPECGISEFESRGNEFSCKKCGLTVEYGEDKRLKATNGKIPFEFIGDWYKYQCDFINGFDPLSYTGEPLYEETAKFSEEIPYQKKIVIDEEAKVYLYGDKIKIVTKDEERVHGFDDLRVVTVLGRNKLNFYLGERVFQLKGSERFNAVKFMNIYFRYKNIKEDNGNGKFLGI
jgi:1-acyl-sn-glycerol-3-phosphate acyltransferase